MSNKLRADITGLRAIAVLAVTLFHISYVLKPEEQLFSGGFLGVDIFFVISGFLMTHIIMRGISNNSFRLWDFYKRRAKRICPALLIVVLVTMGIGLVLLRSNYIYEASKEGLAALGFVSNFRFAKAVDYFDGGDFTHLFLHTWSLSVEWQFYVFYPILLVLLAKFIPQKYIGRIVLSLALLSLVIAVIWTNLNARQSYYLLPSRACELLTGALAYFYPISFLLKLNKINFIRGGGGKIFEVIGILLIILSIIVIDNKDGWPTIWVLLPIVGAWMCIAANNEKSLLSS